MVQCVLYVLGKLVQTTIILFECIKKRCIPDGIHEVSIHERKIFQVSDEFEGINFLKLKYYIQILIIFLLLFAKYFWFENSIFFLSFIFWITGNDFYSADYYPLIPYFFVIVLGYYLWNIIQKYKAQKYFSVKWEYIIVKVLQKIWQKSLIIYLVHQPIIFTIFYIIKI
jgi:uncharacterized membrane protein